MKNMIILAVGVLALGAGSFLITLWFQGVPAPGAAYPNSQHISTTPTPRR